jgi:hypothetical protein
MASVNHKKVKIQGYNISQPRRRPNKGPRAEFGILRLILCVLLLVLVLGVLFGVGWTFFACE